MARPPVASCQCSSVAQWQSIRLLTGGLLVRVQPEEPIFSTSWLRAVFRFLNNSEQFGSNAIGSGPRRAVEHLRVDVHCSVHLGVPHDLRDNLGRHALVVRPRRVRPPERQPRRAWQVRCLTSRPDPPTKTLFGEIGLPDTVEKISSWAGIVKLRWRLAE